jgi:hypothetical protein
LEEEKRLLLEEELERQREEEEMARRKFGRFAKVKSQEEKEEESLSNDEILARLTNRLDDLKEQRFNAYVQLLAVRKEEDGSMFHQGEGVYQCIVINYRGSGSIPMKKETSPIVVSVQRAEPYPVKVKKRYKPRFRSTRIEWTHYSSLYGFFSHSKLIPYSNVTIRYISG